MGLIGQKYPCHVPHIGAGGCGGGGMEELKAKCTVPFGILDNNFIKCKILLKTNHGLLFDEAATSGCLPQIFVQLLPIPR